MLATNTPLRTTLISTEQKQRPVARRFLAAWLCNRFAQTSRLVTLGRRSVFRLFAPAPLHRDRPDVAPTEVVPRRVSVMSSTTDLQVLGRRLAAHRPRQDVVELEKAPRATSPPIVRYELSFVELREVRQQICRHLIALPDDRRKFRQELIVAESHQTISIPHFFCLTRTFGAFTIAPRAIFAEQMQLDSFARPTPSRLE